MLPLPPLLLAYQAEVSSWVAHVAALSLLGPCLLVFQPQPLLLLLLCLPTLPLLLLLLILMKEVAVVAQAGLPHLHTSP